MTRAKLWRLEKFAHLLDECAAMANLIVDETPPEWNFETKRGTLSSMATEVIALVKKELDTEA